MESVLGARLGLDTAALSPGAVKRAVARRCLALGLDGPARYLGQLLRDASEWTALVEEVVVPETWLFRDVGPFEELAAHLRSGHGHGPGRPFRVLSLPCASGEEAWSIAAVLSEAGLSPLQATVDAVDVSPRLVETARRGVYGRSAFRGPAAGQPLERLGALLPGDGGLEVAPALRPYVRFLVGNALEYQAGPPLPCYDVIFCRNLLIYLTTEARRRVTFLADSMLRPGGLMVLGHAEAFSSFFPSYAPVDRPRAFAARKPGGESGRARQGGMARVPAAAAPPRPRPLVPAAPAAPAAPAGKDLLAEARRFAGAGERASVERLCAAALEEDPASLAAHLLLAETALAAGDDARAVSALGKVLYLDPRNESALLRLALLTDRAGDPEAAARLRNRARRAAGAAPSAKAGR